MEGKPLSRRGAAVDSSVMVTTFLRIYMLRPRFILRTPCPPPCAGTFLAAHKSRLIIDHRLPLSLSAKKPFHVYLWKISTILSLYSGCPSYTYGHLWRAPVDVCSLIVRLPAWPSSPLSCIISAGFCGSACLGGSCSLRLSRVWRFVFKTKRLRAARLYTAHIHARALWGHFSSTHKNDKTKQNKTLFARNSGGEEIQRWLSLGSCYEQSAVEWHGRRTGRTTTRTDINNSCSIFAYPAGAAAQHALPPKHAALRAHLAFHGSGFHYHAWTSLSPVSLPYISITAVHPLFMLARSTNSSYDGRATQLSRMCISTTNKIFPSQRLDRQDTPTTFGLGLFCWGGVVAGQVLHTMVGVACIQGWEGIYMFIEVGGNCSTLFAGTL